MPFGECFLQREAPWGLSSKRPFDGRFDEKENPLCRTGLGTEPRPKRDSVGPTNMFGACDMPFGECFLQREAPWGLSSKRPFDGRFDEKENPLCRTGLGTEPRPKRDSVGPTNMFGACDMPFGECFLQREAPWGLSSKRPFDGRFDEKENPLCRTGLGTEPRPKRDSVGPTNMFGACDMPFGECFLQREAPWGLSSKRPFDGRFDEKENPLCRTGLGTEPRPKRDSVGPTNMFGACDMPFGECFLQREAPWGLSSKRPFDGRFDEKENPLCRTGLGTEPRPKRDSVGPTNMFGACDMPFGECFLQREAPWGLCIETAVSMRRRILFAGLDWGRNQDPSGTQLVPPTCLERVTCLLVSVFCRERPLGVSHRNGRLTAVSMRRRILFAGLDWGRNQDPSGTQLVPPTCLERVTCLLVSVFCRERPLGVSHRNGRLTAVSMRRRILFAGLDWGRNQDPSGTQLVPPTCLERVTCLLVSVFCRERPLGVSHRNGRLTAVSMRRRILN